MSLWIPIAALALTLSACGDDTSGCTVLGERQACFCPSGSPGAQTCQPDGEYGVCLCTTPVDAAVMSDAGSDAAVRRDAGSDAGPPPMPCNPNRFHLDAQQGRAYLYKRVAGTSTLLASVATYEADTEFTVGLDFVRNTIRGVVNAVTIIQAKDSSHEAGGIGVYTRGISNASFDNIDVLVPSLAESFDTPLSSEWQTVDNGTFDGPAEWNVSGGSLVNKLRPCV